MGYKAVSDAARDTDLQYRIAGCIATQTGYSLPAGVSDNPLAVASHIMWKCAGQPGWGDAYAYAVFTNVPNPGLDEGVITDGMILSAVQAVLGIE
jgi:hypothetical protein